VINNLLSLQPFCQINIHGIVAVHVLSILEYNTRYIFLKYLTSWKNTEYRFRICLKDSFENAILFSVTKTLLKMLYIIPIFFIQISNKTLRTVYHIMEKSYSHTKTQETGVHTDASSRIRTYAQRLKAAITRQMH